MQSAHCSARGGKAGTENEWIKEKKLPHRLLLPVIRWQWNALQEEKLQGIQVSKTMAIVKTCMVVLYGFNSHLRIQLSNIHRTCSQRLGSVLCPENSISLVWSTQRAIDSYQWKRDLWHNFLDPGTNHDQIIQCIPLIDSRENIERECIFDT